MARVVLIVPPGSYRTPDFVAAARTLRAEVVIASDASQPAVQPMGDGFLEIDFDRPDWSSARIVKFSAEDPVDAVMAVDDHGVVIAAMASTELSLPHNDAAAAAATRDKGSMRARMAAAGVRQPAFAVVSDDADVGAIAARLGFPVVVKPVGLSASQGVIRADDPVGAQRAAERIRALLTRLECAEQPLLVEEYLPGREVALEGLLTDGDLEVLALFDKPDAMDGPFFEETILVAPARVDDGVADEIRFAAQCAAAALGLHHGPVHAEFRIDGRGTVRVLEMAARSIGGLCGRSLRFGLLGASLETVLLRHALGFPSAALDPDAPATGVMMLPIPRSGVLRAVLGLEAARAVAGIVDLEITVPTGHTVERLPEGDRYLGFLFARGESADAVEDSLRHSHAALDIVID